MSKTTWYENAVINAAIDFKKADLAYNTDQFASLGDWNDRATGYQAATNALLSAVEEYQQAVKKGE